MGGSPGVSISLICDVTSHPACIQLRDPHVKAWDYGLVVRTQAHYENKSQEDWQSLSPEVRRLTSAWLFYVGMGN